MTGTLLAILTTIAVSLVPLIELRGAIPLGVAMGLPTLTAVIVATAGNLLLIPLGHGIVLILYRLVHHIPLIHRLLAWVEARAAKHRPTLDQWGWLGLAIFVGVPLPGTGAWSGIILARLVGLPTSKAWLGMALGVIAAGILVGLATQGVSSLYFLVR